MHRFFMPSVNPGRREISLDPRDAKKICRVLKLRPGDEIFLWDSKGKEYRACITKITGRNVFVQVLEQRQTIPEPPFRITLVQGIPKRDKFEFIIQKATELGIWAVQPVVTGRTVVRIPPERRTTRLKRWQVIVKEAARQSGRAHIPVVAEITSLADLWKRLDPDALKLIIWEEGTRPLKEYLRSSAFSPRPPVYLFVGPEGGFEKQEVEEAISHGSVAVSLGPRILRTETAGLIVLSLLLYEWGDLGGV